MNLFMNFGFRPKARALTGLFSEIPVAELVSQTWHDKDSRYRDTRG
jgi:hypothetical protein